MGDAMASTLRSAAVTVLLALTTRAFAQPVEPPPPEPPAPPAPDIAKPDPGAKPEDVQHAEDVAKKAALTPIIPSPNNATQPAFQLYAEIDLPIMAVGTVFALARLTKVQPAYCAPTCDKSTLTGILGSLDKATAGYYSAGWSTASDFALYGLGAAGLALLVADEGVLNTLNDAVVVLEATLSATAVASIMTLAAGRPRPFLYGDPTNPSSYKAPESVRNSADAGLSFLSSHTAMAFAITTSLAVTERRLHPGSPAGKIVLGVGLAISTFVALSRVESGYHFITDVAGGAIVGSSLGWMISSIHNSPVHVVPVVSDKGAGLGLSGSF